MQDMLVSIFGENGAVIVQYVITLAVVVALIALVVWGIRHYGGGTVRPAVRGRLPRLAIIDTLPVDTKRKLVLLRRDNVEHLVLIGGPSDIVVEPSIVRQRVGQRAGQTTATRPTAAGSASSAIAPGPIAPSVEEDAIPMTAEPSPARAAAVAEPESFDSAAAFATRHSTGGGEEAAPERSARPYIPSRRTPVRPAHAAAVSETPRGQRTYSAQEASERDPGGETLESPPPGPRPAPRPERAASRFAPMPPPEEPIEPPNGPVPGYEAVADGHGDDSVSAFAPRAYDAEQGAELDPGDEGHAIELPAAPPTADAEPPEAEDRRDEVNELEQEMARLLGQISTARQQQS